MFSVRLQTVAGRVSMGCVHALHAIHYTMLTTLSVAVSMPRWMQTSVDTKNPRNQFLPIYGNLRLIDKYVL